MGMGSGGQLGTLTRHWVWTGLGALVAGTGLFGLGIAAYLGHVGRGSGGILQRQRESAHCRFPSVPTLSDGLEFF